MPTVSQEDLRVRRYSADEYIRMENEAFEKHEYFDGEIIERAGCTPSHVLITTNLLCAIGKYYLDIPTLEEYVIVAQDEPRVESFLRRPDGTWRFAFWNGLEAAVNLPRLEIDVPLAEIYAGVVFPPTPTMPD